MDEVAIKNLEELIQKSTGPRKKLIESRIKRFSAPGENYLGILFEVKAVLKNEKGELENFSGIAKCPNFKLLEFMGNTIPRHYRKENAFYTEIVPTLEEFQKEVGLEVNGITDIFPKLYASRSSLIDDCEEPNQDSVLLLENLKERGYVNIDRTVGFDLDGAKLVLKDLAAFHAIPLALKLKKTNLFENKIHKHLFKLMGASAVDAEPSPNRTKVEDVWLKMLDTNDQVQPYMAKFREKLKTREKQFKENVTMKAKEPFATISHSDLWTNNTMQMFHDGKPIKNKFIDFQTYDYGSPAQDVIFFLFTSVKLLTLQKHFDAFLKFYHDHLINLIDKCGCDTTPFSYGHFLDEVAENARRHFFHIMFMQIPVYGKKGETVLDMENGPNLKEDNISEETRKRTAYIVTSFAQKGWLEV